MIVEGTGYFKQWNPANPYCLGGVICSYPTSGLQKQQCNGYVVSGIPRKICRDGVKVSYSLNVTDQMTPRGPVAAVQSISLTEDGPPNGMILGVAGLAGAAIIGYLLMKKD
jgi:hypothetical protein